VQAVRDFILQNIDWECEIKTLFRDQNLGCKYAVSGAITWFFDHEDQGIILEDDCVPDEIFFKFCEDNLCLFKSNFTVGHISGCNLGYVTDAESAGFLTKFPLIWGWATWADRWKNYSLDQGYITSSITKDFKSPENRYWVDISIKMESVDTWDYQWVFTLWKNNMYSVVPSSNHIKNIGFDLKATHTKNTKSELASLDYGQQTPNKAVDKYLNNGFESFLSKYYRLTVTQFALKKIKLLIKGLVKV